jgi:hypothetical protein
MKVPCSPRALRAGLTPSLRCGRLARSSFPPLDGTSQADGMAVRIRPNAPRFHALLQRRQGRRIFMMTRSTWDALAVAADEPVLLSTDDLRETPVATAPTFLAATARRTSERVELSIFRADLGMTRIQSTATPMRCGRTCAHESTSEKWCRPQRQAPATILIDTWMVTCSCLGNGA